VSVVARKIPQKKEKSGKLNKKASSKTFPHNAKKLVRTAKFQILYSRYPNISYQMEFILSMQLVSKTS